MLAMRHKLHAHSDVSTSSALRTDKGELLLKAFMEKIDGDCSFGYASIAPRSNGLNKIEELIQAVTENVVSSINTAVKRFNNEIIALGDGRYEVDIESMGDVEVFRKIKVY